MNKSELHDNILACRFYNGEDEAPEHLSQNEKMFWFYESVWANKAYLDNWENELNDMKKWGVTSALGYIDVPDSLQALLFNRWSHWGGEMSDPVNFAEWLNKEYLSRKTNRQRRADRRRPKLIAKCKLYKGEKDNPYENTDNRMYWYYEQAWVSQLSESYNNAKLLKSGMPVELVESAEKNNVPVSLAGLFFNRYEHWNSWGEVHVEFFMDWFENYYCKLKL